MTEINKCNTSNRRSGFLFFVWLVQFWLTTVVNAGFLRADKSGNARRREIEEANVEEEAFWDRVLQSSMPNNSCKTPTKQCRLTMHLSVELTLCSDEPVGFTNDGGDVTDDDKNNNDDENNDDDATDNNGSPYVLLESTSGSLFYDMNYTSTSSCYHADGAACSDDQGLVVVSSGTLGDKVTLPGGIIVTSMGVTGAKKQRRRKLQSVLITHDECADVVNLTLTTTVSDDCTIIQGNPPLTLILSGASKRSYDNDIVIPYYCRTTSGRECPPGTALVTVIT